MIWYACIGLAKLFYFLRLLPRGNWGPEYFAIAWYYKFNKKRADELAEKHFPGSTEWHYEDGDD